MTQKEQVRVMLHPQILSDASISARRRGITLSVYVEQALAHFNAERSDGNENGND